MATDPASKEIGVTDDDLDLEMNFEELVDQHADHTQAPQLGADNLEDPNEDDYGHDVACSEVGVQDDELNDYYEYTQEAERDRDTDDEGELEGIDGYGLGPEDGEDDGYSDSDLEYD